MGRSMIEQWEKGGGGGGGGGVGGSSTLQTDFKTQRVCEINMTECDCKAGRVHTISIPMFMEQ